VIITIKVVMEMRRQLIAQPMPTASFHGSGFKSAADIPVSSAAFVAAWASAKLY
jgi:hypothetical protein